MAKNKFWKIKGFEGVFSDEQIIGMIKDGTIKKDFALSTKEMRVWVKVKDSIYQYYLPKGGEDETI